MGMMGAGKTTVGRALATRLGVPYADNDAALTARTGEDAASYALEHGVDRLHRLEHDILVDAVRAGNGAVVGAPGSIALDPDAPAVLAGQRAVWLRATLDTLSSRIPHDPVRPLLGTAPGAVLAALMREREPGFARLATSVVDVDGLTVDAIVDRIAGDR
jgi:shikimate kinase